VILSACILFESILCTVSSAAQRESPSTIITKVSIVGAIKTKKEVVAKILSIDSGMVYDSLAVEKAVKRLREVRAFQKVTVLHLPQDTGVHLYIVIREYPWFSVSDISGELFSRRYGVSDSFWRLWRIVLGVANSNFRGHLETFRVNVSFWEWRAISVSWFKPFYPSPYFVSTGVSLSDYPYQYKAWRHLRTSASIYLGRDIGNFSRGYLGIFPSYNRLTYHGPAKPGALKLSAFTTTSSGSLPEAIDTSGLLRHDTSWVDSVRLDDSTGQQVAWSGYSNWESDDSTGMKKYGEIYLSLGYALGNARNTFLPTTGWYLHNSLGTNALYAGVEPGGEQNPSYLQWNIDFRLYYPVVSSDYGYMAGRIKTTLRNTDGGRFHIVTSGGANSIRGYATGGLGHICRSNNKISVNIEYRKKLGESQPVAVPLQGLVNLYAPSVQMVYTRWDFAAFFDFGYLWHDNSLVSIKRSLQDNFSPGEKGYSTGFGIRSHLFPVRRSVCFDIAPFVYYPDTDQLTFFYTRFTQMRSPEDKSWKALSYLAWHLYIDMNF
jgi:outer membrane protein assembly factor BamA